MAGPSPRDDYNPTPSVQPTIAAPNDYLQVRSNPDAFGAQVGQGLQKIGATASQVGTEGIDYATQAQGLANEHAANMADMDLAVRGGKVYDQYKQLEGLDAANNKDKAVSDYLAVNDQIRGSLSNPAAQRAYDQIAVRRMSFTVQDMNSYAADQTKLAYRNGNTASMNLSVDQASRFDVANSDNQFGFELGNVKFQVNAMFTSPQYGKYRDITATTAPDGTLKFDQSTQEGKVAQSDYQNYLDQAVGKVWENRIRTLTDDPRGNVITAQDTLQKNKDNIPAATFAKLQAGLIAPYRAAQSKQIADGIFSDINSGYVSSLKPVPGGTFSTSQITDSFIRQESNNGLTSTNLGQIQPGTWQEYARPGEDVNNPKDNRAVTQRIITDLSQKYDGDPAKIAVAYFSGKGNVAPDGSATPWVADTKDKNGKSVSNYVSDIVKSLGVNSNGYQSQADYIRTHYDTYIQQARDQADQIDPGNVAFADQAASQTEARMNNIVHTQELEVRAAQDHIQSVVLGDDKNPPITDPRQLSDNPDPQIRNDWNTFSLNNGYGAQMLLNNVIASNSRGAALGYGSDFYNRYQDIVSGKVSDMSNLYGYVRPEAGKDSPLTVAGLKVLTKTLADRQTPQGAAFAQAEQGFFQSLRGKVTGTGVIPGAYDPTGDKKFTDFMAQALPAIEAGKSSGKSAADLFDPKSPDYVGRFVGAFQRTPAQIMSDMSKTQISPSTIYGGSAGTTTASSQTYNSLPDLQKAYKEGRISKSAATDFAMKQKWIQPNPPPVPKPEF